MVSFDLLDKSLIIAQEKCIVKATLLIFNQAVTLLFLLCQCHNRLYREMCLLQMKSILYNFSDCMVLLVQSPSWSKRLAYRGSRLPTKMSKQLDWPYVINLGNSILGVSILAMPFCFRQVSFFRNMYLAHNLYYNIHKRFFLAHLKCPNECFAEKNTQSSVIDKITIHCLLSLIYGLKM